MSQENEEIVRRWYDAISNGPEQASMAVAEFWDSDIDYYPVRKWPEARPAHGREELADFLSRFLDAFARMEFALERLIAIGDDRVLACANLRAEGRGSGLNLEGDLFTCLWLRNGRIFRAEDHLTVARALRALGLPGESLEAAGLEE